MDLTLFFTRAEVSHLHECVAEARLPKYLHALHLLKVLDVSYKHNRPLFQYFNFDIRTYGHSLDQCALERHKSCT